MATLSYLMLMSLDGFIEDEGGNFDWAAPDDEVHAFINDLVRPAGTHLYGRRMYETMSAWEDVSNILSPPQANQDSGALAQAAQDFAELWQAADKIVYSSTLQTVSTRRTRLEGAFHPGAVEALKQSLDHDILIGGPAIAAEAFKAGLVDQCDLFVAPVSVGGGKPALPPGLRLDFELVEQRRFEGGFVYLRYRTRV